MQADLDGNGTLNCEEFLTIAVHLKKVSNSEQLKKAFVYFDKNQSGYIEFEELREALFDDHPSGAPKNEQLVQDIIFDADLDKVFFFSLNFLYLINTNFFSGF